MQQLNRVARRNASADTAAIVAEPLEVDWTAGEVISQVVAFLRQQQWPIGVGDELRLCALARALRQREIAVRTAADAAQWFAPLLARDAKEQARLPQLLQAWEPTSVQPRALAGRLSEVAQSIAAPRPRSPMARGLAVATLALVMAALAAAAAWWWLTPPAVPDALGTAVARPTEVPSAVVSTVPVQRLIASTLWLLPVALAWLIWYLPRQRRAMLLRGLAPRDAKREALALPLPSFTLYTLESLRAQVAELRRHRLVDASSIDGPRSVAATVRHAGRVTLIRAKRRALPEYLLLVDLKGRDDVLSTLAELLHQLLQQGDVKLERYDFSGDPRHLRHNIGVADKSATEAGVDIEKLRAIYPDHRVLVVTDTVGFGDADGTRMRSWVGKLQEWDEVALLSPLPANQWGPRERALVRIGFGLVEATPDGISTLARLFRADRAEATLAGAASNMASAAGAYAIPLDRRLAADPYRWLGDAAPTAAEQVQLAAELQMALGARPWLYLQALAVFPVLSPRLTMALGKLLDDGRGLPVLSELTLVRLCRVPWLRYGRLPDWLRLMLLRELARDTTAEERVRAAWAVLLEPDHSELGAPANILNLDVVRSVDPTLPALVGRLLERQGQRNYGEALLLAFMNRQTLPELAVRLPTPPSSDRASTSLINAAAVQGMVMSVMLGLAAAVSVGEDAKSFVTWVPTLWVGSLAAGAICVLSWYAHEFRLARWIRSAVRADARAGRDDRLTLAWWPQAFAISMFAQALAASWLAPSVFVPGRMVLACILFVWCFIAHGQPWLRWLPLLVLLEAHWSLPQGNPLLRIELVGGWLPQLLLLWIGQRWRWDQLRQVLLVAAPVCIFSWELTAHGGLGQGLTEGVLLVLAARVASDSMFRRRWFAPSALTWRTVLVLALPLSVWFQIPSDPSNFFTAWYPLDLALVALFMIGWTSRRRLVWLGLTLSVWIASSAPFVLVSETTFRSMFSSDTVGSIGAIGSGILAWTAGRLCRTDASPRAAELLLLATFAGLSVSMEVVSLDHLRSWESPLAFGASLLLAVIPGSLLLPRRRLLLMLALGTAIWTGSMVARVWWASKPDFAFHFGLARASTESFIALVEAVLIVQLLTRSMPTVRRAQMEIQVQQNTEAPLLLLDWGRWTVPAAGLALTLFVMTRGMSSTEEIMAPSAEGPVPVPSKLQPTQPQSGVAAEKLSGPGVVAPAASNPSPQIGAGKK